jgi:hypothetical protein
MTINSYSNIPSLCHTVSSGLPDPVRIVIDPQALSTNYAQLIKVQCSLSDGLGQLNLPK